MPKTKENNINAIEEAKSFEAILNYQKDWIGKKTKLFAYCLLSLSIILAIAVAFLVFKDDKELVLIRVDNTTGYAEVLTRAVEEDLTADEALGKFFASRYVTLREQYIHGSIKEDYRLVQLYSSPAEQQKYLAFWSREDSPDAKYDENFSVKIDILAISITSGTGDFKVATIRFKKNILDLRSMKTTEEHHTARLVYDFTPYEKITNKNRLDNPLGFKVEDYETTKDLK